MWPCCPLIHLRLLYAKMSVNACVSCSTRQVLVFSVRNVLLAASVTVFLGKTKVNDEELHVHREGERIDKEVSIMDRTQGSQCNKPLIKGHSSRSQ